MSVRTSKVVISNEALVLRQMRHKAGLSMRKAGSLIGVSDSYISQIENGRMDVPTGVRLDQLLAIYGGIKRKSFYEKVRNYKVNLSAKDRLTLLIDRLDPSKLDEFIGIAEVLLSRVNK